MGHQSWLLAAALCSGPGLQPGGCRLDAVPALHHPLYQLRLPVVELRYPMIALMEAKGVSSLCLSPAG